MDTDWRAAVEELQAQLAAKADSRDVEQAMHATHEALRLVVDALVNIVDDADLDSNHVRPGARGHPGRAEPPQQREEQRRAQGQTAP